MTTNARNRRKAFAWDISEVYPVNSRMTVDGKRHSPLLVTISQAVISLVMIRSSPLHRFAPHLCKSIWLPPAILEICFICLFGVFCLAQAPSKPLQLQIIVVNSQTEAQSVLNRLQHGESFAALAKQLSKDNTAPDGGFMGEVDPSTLRPEIAGALKGLAPGQITPI
jgi:hypothetical protein